MIIKNKKNIGHINYHKIIIGREFALVSIAVKT
jgi:hypothetical protein